MARDRGLLLCRCVTVKSLVDAVKSVINQFTPAVLYVHLEKPQRSVKPTTTIELLPDSSFPSKTESNQTTTGTFPGSRQSAPGACTSRSYTTFLDYVHKFYAECSTLRPPVDVRLFVDALKREIKNETLPDKLRHSQYQLSSRPDFYLKHNVAHEPTRQLLHYYLGDDAIIREERLTSESTKFGADTSETYYSDSTTVADFAADLDICERFDHVVLGGTFDHLHAGHKMMLTQAVLLARKTLTVGLVVDSVLAHKELAELIEPFETRKLILESFLRDIDPGVQYQIYPLEDKFGPSTVLPELQALVVSAETLSNAQVVNAERSRKSLTALQVVCVDLVSAAELDVANAAEVRLSSTRARHELLGRLLRPQNIPANLPDQADAGKFVIGLTGGSCSGKSNIAAYLLQRNVTVIDCDKLGHAAYGKSTALHRKMIDFYGEEIVDSEKDGEINRAALAKLVFSGYKGGIQQLNVLVWPEIERMTREKIREATTRIVVIDAAVLIEAGWSNFCHEVWVAFVPRHEALRRIQERDHKTLEEAERRLSAQMNNRERIAHAHRVFCSLWERKYTQSQVDRALNDLQHEMS